MNFIFYVNNFNTFLSPNGIPYCSIFIINIVSGLYHCFFYFCFISHFIKVEYEHLRLPAKGNGINRRLGNRKAPIKRGSDHHIAVPVYVRDTTCLHKIIQGTFLGNSGI